jgi:hypothetical protein
VGWLTTLPIALSAYCKKSPVPIALLKAWQKPKRSGEKLLLHLKLSLVKDWSIGMPQIH